MCTRTTVDSPIIQYIHKNILTDSCKTITLLDFCPHKAPMLLSPLQCNLLCLLHIPVWPSIPYNTLMTNNSTSPSHSSSLRLLIDSDSSPPSPTSLLPHPTSYSLPTPHDSIDACISQ